ncbi:MAG: hypothetical protein JXA11_05315 [Phycisphaerae bacterium]|nr:hypothetical protein [Phycisphaerae bacterium]
MKVQETKHPTIVHILNFVRAVEPRDDSIDMFATFVNEAREVLERKLPATFLFQHDALSDERFAAFLREKLVPSGHVEAGVWLEFTRSLIEEAGLEWRGRYSWDWECHVGFTIGYTLEERKRIIDTFMKKFRAVTGRDAKTVGSWFMDAQSLAYLHEKHNVVASCNCRDQWGTDGYSMWGGYWNQAYYPSRVNAFMPAQTRENQIDVPVFRMLGSDPIYQYEAPLGDNGQGVVTLEPAFAEGGGDPEWVRWFFRQMTEHPALSFAYAQAGQENSFGWERIGNGYLDQMKFLDEQWRASNLRLETMSQTGEWFRGKYPLTPAAATVALEDWRRKDRTSIWYNSRFYRANLYTEGTTWRLRDVHLFDEGYSERYLDAASPSPSCLYDTLPVMDGFLWSAGRERAGIYPGDKAGALLPMTGKPTVAQIDENTLRVSALLADGGSLVTTFHETEIEFSVVGRANWRLAFRRPDAPTNLRIEEHAIHYVHENRAYSARFDGAELYSCESGVVVVPAGAVAVRLGFQREGRDVV